ncbi:MAG TPA: T9SS type A sorting domain-containing protein, partial [Chitinophagales bacterium]|nr:T9SS type A sorting domain-containing protein [Chitinophagales bacterium]
LNKIYGIVTDNSGATGALMFKNTFSNTSSGFQSQNGNPNFAASCNTFTNYTYSGSYGPAWYTYNGTLRQQGNNVCTNSGDRAGNEWTSTCTGSNVVDIKINGSGSYFHYYGHFLDQQLGDKTRPECSTTGWETSSWLHYCPNPTDPGYTKSSSACDFPFYTCPGCRVSGNDLGIDPQLLQAMDYYQSMADDFSAQSESASGQSAIEQSAYYAGLVQLVSNEIVSQLLSRSVDTAILYLEGSDLLEDKKLLAELYLSVGRFDDCRKTVDNVIAAQGWKRAELLNADDIASYSLENNEFVELLNLLLSIFESGRGLDKSDEQEIAALEGLSQSLTVNGPKACAYLKAATGKECSYSIYSDEQGEQVKERLGGSEQGSNIEVKAYPNPANTQLNISVFIPEGSIKPELIVYDITGRKQEQILLNTKQNEIELNTSSYGEGVYLLQVKTVDSSRTLRVSVQK